VGRGAVILRSESFWSASGIKISLKRLADERDLEIDMTIDLSHFKKPENIRMKEPDIVQAILVCMRAYQPDFAGEDRGIPRLHKTGWMDDRRRGV
jgi:hypothetical protein